MSIVISLVNEGDSISTGAYTHAYMGIDPALVPATGTSMREWIYTTNGLICNNRSYPGSRLDSNGPSGAFPGDLTFRAAAVDALIAPTSSPLRVTGVANARPTRKYIFSVWIGHNVSDSNPTTFTASLGTYLLARRSAGFNKIIVGTLISRGDNILTNESIFETYRQGVNTILRAASWQSTYQVDAIFDIGAEPTIGAAGACDNLSLYNSDKIHPLDASYAPYITPLYLAAVNAVKATL